MSLRTPTAKLETIRLLSPQAIVIDLRGKCISRRLLELTFQGRVKTDTILSIFFEGDVVAIDSQVIIILYLSPEDEPAFQEKINDFLPGDGRESLAHSGHLVKGRSPDPFPAVLG